MTILKNQAIHKALMGDWEAAISLNLELLNESPNDIETLNRLAFAFSICGKTKDAKSTYQKVLEIDSQNPIALKNLKKLSGSEKITQRFQPFVSGQIDNMFLEESGKTKIVELLNIATANIITKLMIGEPLILKVKRFKIFVLNSNNEYIGVLPDDLGRRLIRFIEGGNNYEAYIKSTEDHKVSIFVRETKRAARFKNQPSFISSKSHLVLEKNFNEKPKAQPDLDED